MPADPDIPLNRPYVPGMRGFGPTFGQPQPRHGGGSQNIPPRTPPPFPGQVVTVPAKRPGYAGNAYNNVFKRKLDEQKRKKEAAALRAGQQRVVTNQARAARAIISGTVTEAFVGANADVANQIMNEMFNDHWARQRGGRAAEAELHRYGDAASYAEPYTREQIERQVDRPLEGYKAPTPKIKPPNLDVPTYSPPLQGPSPYNETVYGPEPSPGGATAPRPGAAVEPRGGRGVWEAPATAPATHQTPGINPAVGPGPQTVIDKFIQSLERQLDQVVRAATRPKPSPPKILTVPRAPVAPGLTDIREPSVGSSPQVFPGQSTALNATPATRPDAKPNTQTAQCECGPPKKKGECAQGYFTQTPNGDVQYKIWSRRKCL
jgi:hypothetical protein